MSGNYCFFCLSRKLVTYRVTTRRALGDGLVQVLTLDAASNLFVLPSQVALVDELPDEKARFDLAVFFARRFVEGDGVDAVAGERTTGERLGEDDSVKISLLFPGLIPLPYSLKSKRVVTSLVKTSW